MAEKKEMFFSAEVTGILEFRGIMRALVGARGRVGALCTGGRSWAGVGARGRAAALRCKPPLKEDRPRLEDSTWKAAKVNNFGRLI